MKLGVLTAAFPTLSLDARVRLGHQSRLRNARGGRVALQRDGAEAICRDGPYRRSEIWISPVHRGSSTDWPQRVCQSRRLPTIQIRSTPTLRSRLRLSSTSDGRGRCQASECAQLSARSSVATRIGPWTENFEVFAGVWPSFVRFAGDNGIRIAIENCPMLFSQDEWPGGNNLAYNPANWRRMFEVIPDMNFGLNFDPSHLVWQQIDIARAVREFGPRIFHVHAKDLRDPVGWLYEHGVMSAGIGWQVPRLCGWDRWIGAASLARCIQSATTTWRRSSTRIAYSKGTVLKVQRGFEIARDNLRRLYADVAGTARRCHGSVSSGRAIGPKGSCTVGSGE